MRPSATLRVALCGLALTAPVVVTAQTPTRTVADDINTNTTWATGEVILLDGLVYVEPNVTLTIQPGVIVKGQGTPSVSTGDLASGLVVQWDGRLVADGTAAQPIIFTAEADNVADLSDLDETDRGFWGGVILLGRAQNNRGVRNIEGIPTSDDTQYGCDGGANPCDNADDSGVLRYVSIRHAGFGFQPSSEINGLTLGAVGNGTVIEYVEVFANSDDSFEWFGGTVDAKYLVAAFSGDDEFDWDTGYTGRGQFWFSIKNESGETGRCAEMDGAASPFNTPPLSDPTLSNVTCLGVGVGGTAGGSDAGSPALIFRDNSAGNWYNSVVTDFNNLAIEVEDVAGSTDDSRERFAVGDLVLDNNLFFGFGAGSDFAAATAGSDGALETAIAAENQFVDPQLVALDRGRNGVLDPRPQPSGPAASGADFSALADPFFTSVAYRGAFAPDEATWLSGWSVLDDNGYLSDAAVPAEDGPSAASFRLRPVGPNPAEGTAAVAFELDRAQTVRLAVYDVTGREVAVLAEGTRAAGVQTVALDVAALPAGVYVLRLAGEGGTATQRFTVAK